MGKLTINYMKGNEDYGRKMDLLLKGKKRRKHICVLFVIKVKLEVTIGKCINVESV